MSAQEMIALVFSGVGSLSKGSAELKSVIDGMACVDAIRARLSEAHGVNLDEMWDRVAKLGPSSTGLSALDEIVMQMVLQLAGAQVAQESVGDAVELMAVGHSVGELAAAVFSGHVSASDAVDVAVELAKATEKFRGGLVFGDLREGDEVASLNHHENDTAVGAAAFLEGELDDRKKVHTGYPWHHSNHKQNVGDFKLAGVNPSTGSKALATSLQGGFVEGSTKLDEAYWASWTHTGVNLEKALAATKERYNDKLSCVVELGAHPMLQATVRAVVGEQVPQVALFNRDVGFNYAGRQQLIKLAKSTANLERAVADAFPVKLEAESTWLENGLGSSDLVEAAAKLRSSGAFPGLQPQDLYRFVTPKALIEGFGANASTASGASVRTSERAPVVIRAMSCILPGNLKTPAQLGAFTSTQGDAVSCDTGFDGGKQPAAFLGEISIEYAKFGLSKSEMTTMDPQQALVLNCVDKLLEEHEIVQLPASTGVYIGAWNTEYEGDQSSVFYPTGTNQSLIAARISHVYRLHGPCKVVNSACASSLDAILEAYNDVARGKVEYAIAGGVNLLWNPEFSTCMAQSGFLAPGGRCRSFDTGADGYVRAEGCGLVLITRKDLCKDNKFYAEILGGASNQNGGRGASITAPSPIAQEECIGQALKDAAVNPADIDYVECHGTGTKLGDPIEWSALANSIGQHRAAENPCLLASVKSNIGHLESAAGVAGVIHAAMILAKKEVPRMGNFTKANPLLEQCNGLKLANSANIKAPHLAVAGVSSFGFGGSNVHLILRAGTELPETIPPVAPAKRGDLFVFDRTQSRKKAEAAAAALAAAAAPAAAAAVAAAPVQAQVQQVSSEDSMRKVVIENTFWEVVQTVAGKVDVNAGILQSGIDSLGLTELFLRIEQKLGVEAAELSEFLGGNFKWEDLQNRILGATCPAIAAQSTPVAVVPAAKPRAQSISAQPKQQSSHAPASEGEDVTKDYFTWGLPRFEGYIRTTHVGSLPRPREIDNQYKALDALIQKQLEMGISIINDGETGRLDYATAVLTRMTGFAEQDVTTAPQPQDLEDLPCIARRYLVRAGLITLNKSVKTCNPHCVGEIKFTGHNALQRELETVRRAFRLNNAGLPGQCFWSAPSPGTLAMFLNCDAPDVYPNYEAYLKGLADALHEEYKTVVANGFTLQVDCPDLAMSRHTKFKNLGLMAWKDIANKHVEMLNRALEGIPRECVRVHVCWGNYSSTHHRDVHVSEVLPIALKIDARGFGFESANQRHGADFMMLAKQNIKDDVVLYPGVVDTCSLGVESPELVCERICKFVKLVGPERVVANTDCGFSSTAEAQGLPGQVAWMKLRSLVAGARMATNLYYPKAMPAFIPRPEKRVFYFSKTAESALGCAPAKEFNPTETRVVITGLLAPSDALKVSQHIRLFVDVPVAFETDGSDEARDFAELVKSNLSDGKARNSPAFPIDESNDPAKVKELGKEDMVFDTSASKLKSSYEVVIVGAGVVGLLAAKRLSEKGVDVVVLEKSPFVGGIWTTYANSTSQVNSSEGSYRPLSDYRKRPNRDHSTTHEIRTDILQMAEELRKEGRIFTNTEVDRMDPDGVDASTGRKKYQVTLKADGSKIASSGVILAINDRVGEPHPITWKQHELFQGKLVDGFGGDAEAKNVDWTGKRVVVVGMGAFAVENARTALERGAKNVVVLARRHGTICPKFIDYINFVHRGSVDSSGGDMDTANNSKNMFLWRKMYENTNCTMPECWLDLIKHSGHTISVSDVWFIAHFLGKLETLKGEIDHFVEDGIILRGSEQFIEADIVVRCTGFQRNANLVPKISPYSKMSPINYLDENVMYLADAYIDDNAFNSFFGSSVVEMSKFFIMIYEHYLRGGDLESLDAPELAPTVDVTDRKWTDYIHGAEYLVNNVSAIREKANALLHRRYLDFVETQSVEEYVAANRREWIELHDILSQGTLEEDCMLPYPEWKA